MKREQTESRQETGKEQEPSQIDRAREDYAKRIAKDLMQEQYSNKTLEPTTVEMNRFLANSIIDQVLEGQDLTEQQQLEMIQSLPSRNEFRATIGGNKYEISSTRQNPNPEIQQKIERAMMRAEIIGNTAIYGFNTKATFERGNMTSYDTPLPTEEMMKLYTASISQEKKSGTIPKDLYGKKLGVELFSRDPELFADLVLAFSVSETPNMGSYGQGNTEKASVTLNTRLFERFLTRLGINVSKTEEGIPYITGEEEVDTTRENFIKMIKNKFEQFNQGRTIETYSDLKEKNSELRGQVTFLERTVKERDEATKETARATTAREGEFRAVIDTKTAETKRKEAESKAAHAEADAAKKQLAEIKASLEQALASKK